MTRERFTQLPQARREPEIGQPSDSPANILDLNDDEAGLTAGEETEDLGE